MDSRIRLLCDQVIILHEIAVCDVDGALLDEAIQVFTERLKHYPFDRRAETYLPLLVIFRTWREQPMGEKGQNWFRKVP